MVWLHSTETSLVCGNTWRFLTSQSRYSTVWIHPEWEDTWHFNCDLQDLDKTAAARYGAELVRQARDKVVTPSPSPSPPATVGTIKAAWNTELNILIGLGLKITLTCILLSYKYVIYNFPLM